MNLGELFDGKLHYLEPEEDFKPPWLICEDIVEMEAQPNDLDPLENPDVNLVTVEASLQTQTFWNVDHGWSAFSTLLQDLGRALGGKAVLVHLNHWPNEGEPFGTPEEVEYTMRYKPDGGWEGGVL